MYARENELFLFIVDLNITQVVKPDNNANKVNNINNKGEQTKSTKDNGFYVETSGNNITKKKKTADRLENKNKKRKYDEIVTDSKVSFRDVGGIEHILKVGTF